MKMVTVDYNKLSEWGLIHKINKEVLHPLGLAMTRNPDTGASENCIVADDFEWKYHEDIIDVNEEKFKEFSNNRVEILTEIINDNK